MNHIQIRQIHQAAREELVRSSSEDRQKIQRDLKRLQAEFTYATEHCPNRCTCLRAEMDGLNQKLATDELASFDEFSQPYLDRIDQLKQDEIEAWFKKMHVVYSPNHRQSQTNTFGGSGSNAPPPTTTNSNDLYVCSKCDEVRVCDEFERFVRVLEVRRSTCV